MFSIFKKDPIKKLDKVYASKLEEAMHAQRNGDIKSYAMITAEAEKIKVKILELQASAKT
ncbi:Lacal_2735 family protein [Thalassotalea sp. HSM 43]|uniref:DUF6435 family protein n=1 Tax=Thalassotalea sp. HSM 43 TaxID=2552945 RepID=UPI0010807E48|nr:DUF6435 family protein [Thalassotalea sp. HSM 43]QBY05035.1 Lacal_2735 family protein [Thalassotalea sp. HSM 43]